MSSQDLPKDSNPHLKRGRSRSSRRTMKTTSSSPSAQQEPTGKQLRGLQVPGQMGLVSLSLRFKVTPLHIKAKCQALWRYREVKAMGPSSRKAPAHWRYKTRDHEVPSGAELVVDHGELRSQKSS